MAEYRVVYKRDKNGGWLGTVRGFPGRHGRGRTIREARAHLREALAGVLAEKAPVDFLEDVRLAPPARRLLVRHWAARRKAQQALAQATEAARRACEALMSQEVSLRDASDLLGLPPARLLPPGSRRPGRPRARRS